MSQETDVSPRTTTPWTITSLARFFRITDDADVHEIWWRANEPQYEPFKLLINCNDLFYWACADSEEITPDNLDVLEQAFADLRTLSERWRDWHKAKKGNEGSPPFIYMHLGLELFCARVRKMRPQGACYDKFPPEVAALFDAAGPPRGDKTDTKRREWNSAQTK